MINIVNLWLKSFDNTTRIAKQWKNITIFVKYRM
jgi:hypothetical protein